MSDQSRAVLSGHLALVAVQLQFGLFPVFGRLAMNSSGGFSPWGVATWRVIVGALVLGSIGLAVYGRRAFPRRADLGRVALCGVVGIVANQGLYLAGLERSTATNAGLVMCLIPVFTFVVAILAKQETFSPRRGLGVLVAMAGAVPLFLSRGATLSPEHAWGNLLMGANTLAYAGYLVLARPLLGRYPPLLVLAWIYAVSLPFVPLFAMQGGLLPEGSSDPAGVSRAAAWWALGYILVFPTVLAYLLNLFALARVRASTTAFYIYAQPLISALAGRAILKEQLAPMLLVSAAGLIVGSALVLTPERKAASHAGPRTS